MGMLFIYLFDIEIKPTLKYLIIVHVQTINFLVNFHPQGQSSTGAAGAFAPAEIR